MANRVTREDLKGIPLGCSKTFALENAKACDSAKATAYQMQNILGCKFKVSTDYSKNEIQITREAL